MEVSGWIDQPVITEEEKQLRWADTKDRILETAAKELYFDYVGDLNGHYYYVSQEGMAWHDGLNFADTVDVDGFVHMVTINSEEENNFLANALYSYGSEWTWLGLTDEYEEGNWQWVTGEPLSYTSWAEGQPNNTGGCTSNECARHSCFHNFYDICTPNAMQRLLFLNI